MLGITNKEPKKKESGPNRATRRMMKKQVEEWPGRIKLARINAQRKARAKNKRRAKK